MDRCRIDEDLLLQYLDHELDPVEAAKVEAHLISCERCASFVAANRSLEEIFSETTPGPLKNSAFLQGIIDGVDVGGHGGIGIVRKLTAIGAAAAVILVLIILFFQIQINKSVMDNEIVQENEGQIESYPVENEEGLEDKERELANEELHSILIEIADLPDYALADNFKDKTVDLRQRGWRVDRMLVTTLKGKESIAVHTAIRLAGLLDGFKNAVGAVPALVRLQDNEIYLKDVFKVLVILDGPQAETALGRALDDPKSRDMALDHLCQMEGEGAASQIEKALLKEARAIENEISPFSISCATALCNMGDYGVDGILKFFQKTGHNPAVIRAISPPGQAWINALILKLPKMRGASFETGIRIASILRLEDTIELMCQKTRRSRIDKKAPNLISCVGGPEAVISLYSLYCEPISMKERKSVSHALSRIFELYPDETGSTLDAAFVSLKTEDPEILIEMLAGSKTRGSCLALGWILNNRPDLATLASLCLARLGTEDAINTLTSVLMDPSINEESMLAASAAAFHLGGPSVVKAITAFIEDGNEQSLKDAFSLMKPRQRSLTDNRFEKLCEYITNYQSH